MNFGSGMQSYVGRSASSAFGAMDPEAHGVQVDNEPDVQLGINDIGMSVPMGIAAQNVAGVYSKIRMGAGNLEIQFPGYAQGNRQAQTPEFLGDDQRQALRELQLANDVRFNTHASYNLMGMLGRDQRGNFSITGAYNDLFELKKSIDFAGDVGGGSVVMHSGEFERPMTDMFMDDETHTRNLARDENGRLLIRQAHTQEFDASFDLLDSRTSNKIEGVEKDVLVPYPVWNRATHDHEGMDDQGNKVWISKGDYVNYAGEQITDPYSPTTGRVPIFNEETREFETEQKHFDYFKKEAAEYNEYLEKTLQRKPTYMEKVYPEEMWQRAKLETQAGNARGWSGYYGESAKDDIEQLKGLKKALDFYKKVDETLPEEEKWKLLRDDNKLMQLTGGILPGEQVNTVDYIENAIKERETRVRFSLGSSASQKQQAQEIDETKKNIITPIKRLEQSGVRMYAEAGIHAMNKSRDPNNPVVVAIENLFPDRFGGHIEELKWIIKKSRNKMVELLTAPTINLGVSRNQQDLDEESMNAAFDETKEEGKQENPFYLGISQEEAEELADRHIKATIDTGHLNMWRKYWQNDPKLSKEENDALYKDWYLKQIESIAKEGMIGNVHLADNYGYDDSHLSPGQGNAPIKESVAIMKKHGYDDAITVEPGADATTDLSDFHGLMKTWRLFGGNIYGIGGGGGGSGVQSNWSGVQYGYLGQGKPPNFVFGNYAPSNDWTLWSSVPME